MDSGIKKIADRIPFTGDDLKTKDGFWRKDEGVLKYLDQLGIKYTLGEDIYHNTVE